MSRGRGRGKTFGGPRSLLPGDLSLGSLTYSDVLSTAQALRGRSAGSTDLWDYSVETPDTKGPDTDERKEARWGTRVAMGNGMGGLEVRGGKYWLAVGSTGKAAKGKAKAEGQTEPWLYSERYKKASTSADASSSAPTKRLPLLAPSEKALLDPSFFPPELWSSYYNPKPLSPRKRKGALANGTAKKKTKIGVEGLVGQFEDAEGEEGGEKEDEEAEQQDDDEEGEEEDVRAVSAVHMPSLIMLPRAARLRQQLLRQRGRRRRRGQWW